MFEALQSLLNDPLFQSKVKHITRIAQPNEKILQQGKMHAGVYLIKKGKLKVAVSGEIEKKQEVHPGIAELGPDDVFGEFALFDDEPASADVIAIVESELVEVDIPSFRAFLEANPKIGYAIFFDMLKSLTQRLRHADKTIFNLYAWGIRVHHIDQYLG